MGSACERPWAGKASVSKARLGHCKVRPSCDAGSPLALKALSCARLPPGPMDTPRMMQCLSQRKASTCTRDARRRPATHQQYAACRSDQKQQYTHLKCRRICLLSSMHPLLSHVPSPRATLTYYRFLVSDWSPLPPLHACGRYHVGHQSCLQSARCLFVVFFYFV